MLALGAILAIIVAVMSPGFWMIIAGLAGNILLVVGRFETLPTWMTVLAWVCLAIAYLSNGAAFWWCWSGDDISTTGFWFGIGWLVLAAAALIASFFVEYSIVLIGISAFILLVLTMVSSTLAELWMEI